MGSRRNFRRLIFLFIPWIALTLLLPLGNVGAILKNKKDIENLDLFIKPLKESCNTGFLIKNLKHHSSYPRFGSVKKWKNFCVRLNSSKDPKDFLLRNLDAKIFSYEMGLLTGYYEPLVHISYDKDSLYKYPILKKSEHLMIPRRKILTNYKKKDVIGWAKNDINLFFLQIQGSGIGLLKSGEMIKISYAGNNGYEYSSIGKYLIKKSFLTKEDISADKIKKWLKENKKKRNEVFSQNRRYIFFKFEKFDKSYPKGAGGVALTPKISIAVDNKIYPYGIPVLTQTNKKKYNLILITHDTGSAIKGPNRGDLFVGRGEKAGSEAGKLIEKLKLYYLTPKNE